MTDVRLRWSILLILLCGCLAAFQTDERSRQLATGRLLLRQQAWQAAANEFEKVLKAAPKDADAHIGLGIALWGAGNRGGALASFRRATETNPSSPEARFNVALALRDSGELAKAIAEARTALKLRPAYDDAQLALGLMLQQQGDIAGAVAEYKLVLKRNPRSAEAHNWLGVAHMQKNQLPDAIAAFRQATKLKPDFVRAFNNLGSTLAQAGDLQEGIDAFQAGLVYAPGDLQLNLNLGAALRTKGDTEGAIRHFQIVLKQDPDNGGVHHQLGLALRDRGDLDGAIRELETALKLNPESQESYYVLGQALRQVASAKQRQFLRQPSAEAQDALTRAGDAMERGDVPGAIQLARKAVAADAGAAATHSALGLLLGRSGDLKGAVESFSRAVALEPAFGETHYHLGAALWYAGDRSKAAAELETAVALNPASGEAYSLRALAYREAGDLDSARRNCQRAIAVNPKLPVAYFDLGVLFLRLNRLEQALGQFEAGLNLPGARVAPPDLELAIRELRAAISEKQVPEAHIVLGRLLGLAGAEPKPVIAEFEAALRIKPDSPDALNNLGLVYRQTNEDEKAIAAFRHAIRLSPGYADAHANLGAILTATDVAEAIHELEKAIELQPGLLRAHYNLAIAYGSSPKHGSDREIQQLQKLLALDANYPRADFALGKALLRKGNVPDAVTHLERAARLEPQFGEAHYQLGLALTRAGRSQEAAVSLQKGRDLVASGELKQNILLDIDEGKAALEKGDLDNALAKFRRVLKARPDLAEVHYQVGLALVRKGDTGDAEASFRKAIELAPAHTAAKQELDRIVAAKFWTPVDDSSQVAALERYILDSKFVEAQPLLEAYVKARPNSSWGWYALGYSLFAQRKITESVNALAKSLSLDTSNADAHKVLGRVLMLIGRFDAAQKEFELGEKYNPKSAEHPFNLGRLFSIQDQWVPAREAFERSIKVDPSYMEAYDGLGFALETLGETEAAVANYLKAAQFNDERKGSFTAPYVNLSTFYNRTGDADTALTFAKKAIAINAKADRAWFQMARAYERKGEPEAAIDAVKRAIEINANVSSYHYVLATMYRRLGKQQESREAMEVFTRLDRESNSIEQRRRDRLRQEPND